MGLNYSEEEMNLLANTPQLVGAAMAFVGSSGLFGTGKEMFTNARSIMAGIKDYPNNALIQAVLPNVAGDSGEALEKMKKIRQWGIDRMKAKGVNSAEKFRDAALEDLKAVNALLASKSSSQEADEYKQWAMSIAEKVAMATTEGSFLGFGGEQFSANEKAFLAQIESALGTKSLLA